MKLRTFFTSLTLGGIVGLVAIPAQAQTATPCETYKCVAGLSGYGASPTPGCAPALQAFFKIAVFNPPLGATGDTSTEHAFDAEATAAERKKYLLTCPEAAADSNASTLNAIINKWMNAK